MRIAVSGDTPHFSAIHRSLLVAHSLPYREQMNLLKQPLYTQAERALMMSASERSSATLLNGDTMIDTKNTTPAEAYADLRREGKTDAEAKAEIAKVVHAERKRRFELAAAMHTKANVAQGLSYGEAVQRAVLSADRVVKGETVESTPQEHARELIASGVSLEDACVAMSQKANPQTAKMTDMSSATNNQQSMYVRAYNAAIKSGEPYAIARQSALRCAGIRETGPTVAEVRAYEESRPMTIDGLAAQYQSEGMGYEAACYKAEATLRAVKR